MGFRTKRPRTKRVSDETGLGRNVLGRNGSMSPCGPVMAPRLRLSHLAMRATTLGLLDRAQWGTITYEEGWGGERAWECPPHRGPWSPYGPVVGSAPAFVSFGVVCVPLNFGASWPNCAQYAFRGPGENHTIWVGGGGTDLGPVSSQSMPFPPVVSPRLNLFHSAVCA